MRIKKIVVSYVMRFLCPMSHTISIYLFPSNSPHDDSHDDHDDNDCTTQIDDKGMKEFHKKILCCVS